MTVDGIGIPLADGQVLGTFVTAQTLGARPDLVIMGLSSDRIGLWLSLDGVSNQLHKKFKLVSREPSSAKFPATWQVALSGERLNYTSFETTGSFQLPRGARIVVNSLSSQATPSGGMSVTLETEGRSEDRPSTLHDLAVLIGLLAFGIMVFLSVTPTKRSIQTRVRMGWLKPSRQDLTVLASCVAAAMITMPFADDGWVLARSRLLAVAGWSLHTQLIDPYQEGIANIQGFIYESVLGLTVGRSNIILVERSLTIVAILLTWLIFSRVVIPRFVSNPSKLIRWLFVGMFILYTWGWMTLRAEVIINLCSMALLGVLVSRRFTRNPPLQILLLGCIAGLALSTHQTGTTTCLAAGIAILILLIRDRRNWIQAGSSLIGALGILTLLIFVNQNIPMLLGSMNDYTNLQEVWGHSPSGLLGEMQRLQHYSIVASTPQRLFFTICLVGVSSLIIGTITLWGKLRRVPSLRLVVLASLVMPVGLLVTSSKWAWHYSVLLVPGLVGLLLAIEYFRIRTSRKISIFLLGTCSVIAIYYAVSTTDRDTSYSTPILLLSAVLVGFMYLYVGVGTGRVVPISTCLIWLFVVIVVGLEANSVRAGIVNSASGWTFPRQSISGILDPVARCGVPSFIPSLSHEFATAQEEVDSVGGLATTRPDSYLFSPCIQNPGYEGGLWQPTYFSVGNPDLGQQLFASQPNLPRDCLAKLPSAPQDSWSCVEQLLPYEVPVIRVRQ